jgi:adenine-specific DNA glycosylase
MAALCAMRGASAEKQKAPRRKAALYYALARRSGSVLLRQRPRDRSLMPGMWELPELDRPAKKLPVFELRHSITTTDYSVLVFAGCRTLPEGRWVSLRKVKRMALTGLAVKILRRAEALPSA